MTPYNKKNIPEYYDSMYLDGFTPEEIMFARKKSMLAERDIHLVV